MCSCYFCAALYANRWNLTSTVFTQFTLEIIYFFPISGLFLLFAMAGLCSFQAVTGVTCGSRRGFTNCVALNRCDGDLSSHLQKHCLSSENVCKKDLILERAGLLELTEEQIKNLTVCPAPRFYPWKVLTAFEM